jgi:cytochrome c-type biogenesis protein CcmH/NrfG
VSGFRAWFRELPSPLRWTLLSVVAVLLLVAVGSGMWSWRGRRESAAQLALGSVLPAVQQSVASSQPAELEAAAKGLRDFLASHSGTHASQQAWYLLGQVEFQRRQWDAAATAFSQAARGDGGSIAVLSRMGQGYALEAKGEPTRALEAYQQVLAGRGPKDFLYGDLLLAKARAQELSKDPSGAIATYQQYLKDLPSTDRALDVRIRLALLGNAG